MKKLSQQMCEACRADSPPLSAEELAVVLRQLPDWHLVRIDGIPRFEKVYRFSNFKNAMDFACEVGEQAEQVNHHPALLVEWGQVTVQWWTHKIAGVHTNDAIMAAKTDLLFSD